MGVLMVWLSDHLSEVCSGNMSVTQEINYG